MSMRLEGQLLVVGCGHSGTFFISEVFQHLGIDVRHELVGSDGAAGWNYTHLLPAQFVEFGLREDVVIFHQVRHPLDVISSVQSMEERTWVDVGIRANSRGYNWNPLDDRHPVRGMKYYLLWNYFAECIAHYTYRIENISSALPVILGMIGVPKADLPPIPKSINKHKYDHTFTWDDLMHTDAGLYELVLSLSRKYGYAKQR
jgi:hypothetical protein